jgi:hypothetical protein
VTFSQFIEYLLWRLYLQEGMTGAGQFYDLNEFASELLASRDQQWVLDGAKVLESRGLARVVLALGGYASGMLTGEGRLYVEDRINQDGSFLKELSEHPGNYIIIAQPEGDGRHEGHVFELPHGAEAPEIKSLEEQRAPVNELLDDLVTAIDAWVPPEDDRDDLLADIDAIRAQLRKREPNLNVIAGILDPIPHRWPALAASVSRLSSLLFV